MRTRSSRLVATALLAASAAGCAPIVENTIRSRISWKTVEMGRRRRPGVARVHRPGEAPEVLHKQHKIRDICQKHPGLSQMTALPSRETFDLRQFGRAGLTGVNRSSPVAARAGELGPGARQRDRDGRDHDTPGCAAATGASRLTIKKSKVIFILGIPSASRNTSDNLGVTNTAV